MKVPEKIYRHQTTGNPRLNGIYYEHKPAKIRYDDKIIEYIRKDAFIEKLCTWIKENSEMYIECEDHFYTGWLTEDFYKELRKAMEE